MGEEMQTQVTPADPFAGFTKTVAFRPAFDKRSDDPTKNYGVGAVLITFTLSGPLGATFYVMGTGWYLPHVGLHRPPDGWEIGIHSPVPSYDGARLSTDQCEYLGGRPCYSDSSATAAIPVVDALIRDGDAAVWRELLRWYDDTFRPVAEVAP